MRATLLFLCALAVQNLVAQVAVSPEEAVAAAIAHHPALAAANAQVAAKTAAERAALHLPDPEVNAESPTGEFYAVGLLQSFEFPTVYGKQKKVAQAETQLARAERSVLENEVRYQVRQLYLDAQLAEAEWALWHLRDSIYQAIAQAAVRQFEAGEIDLLQKINTEQEAGTVRAERNSKRLLADHPKQQLQLLTGLEAIGPLWPLAADTVLKLPTQLANTPLLQAETDKVTLAQKQTDLEQSRALPDFSIGYLNQGPRNTPLDYRLRATVGIPIWVGQYKAATKAAQHNEAAAEHSAAAQRQALDMELLRVMAEAQSAKTQVLYYQKEALPRSQTLLQTALRLREAGQIDYIALLKNADNSFAVQEAYLHQVKNMNQSLLQWAYLVGQ